MKTRAFKALPFLEYVEKNQIIFGNSFEKNNHRAFVDGVGMRIVNILFDRIDQDAIPLDR